MTQSAILEINGLSKSFRVGSVEINALRPTSLDVKRGECLAIVGESGSGKTTLANLILGIHRSSAGEVRFEGEVLPGKREQQHRRAIQLVQQNPLSSLNPRRSIGASIRLALDIHNRGPRSERNAQVHTALEAVGLSADLAQRRPDALSGGQRQRVAIARALASEAPLIILDEPTASLDVLVQARVLRLLQNLREQLGLTYIFISHDLSVVRNIADRVAVFRKGEMVELADRDVLFSAPSHHYTRSLIASVPVVTDDELALRAKLAPPAEDNQP